ncbi:hypothetical protein LWI29_021845 [Acer saccharum]|uniref:Uncharacterized protein n=1 Tax=Acer saccharum TaxID=4024 RepID=A0AA39T6X6_ACESA|nr:hypothetical protein LWI29_021845 [Acer saccharum]
MESATVGLLMMESTMVEVADVCFLFVLPILIVSWRSEICISPPDENAYSQATGLPPVFFLAILITGTSSAVDSLTVTYPTTLPVILLRSGISDLRLFCSATRVAFRPDPIVFPSTATHVASSSPATHRLFS